MVRVVALALIDGKAKETVRWLNPLHVMWVAEGGPGYCHVRMSDGHIDLKVLGPASELAKKLATSEPHDAQESVA